MDHEIEPTNDSSTPLPFEDLQAPTPLDSSPPASARWLAFGLILLGGLLGGLVGYGIGEIMGGNSTWAAVGGLFGGLTGAIGVGIVANLTLRAMNEWRAVQHPESEPGSDKSDQAAGNESKRARNRAKKKASKQWTRRPSA